MTGSSDPGSRAGAEDAPVRIGSVDIDRGALDRRITEALAEDVGDGDRTTAWTLPAGATGRAAMVAKASLVLAGTQVAARVFHIVDPGLRIERLLNDGERAAQGTEVMRVEGRLASILEAERTALNFIGRLAGIATLTRRFVDAVEGTGARILDTRKTTPGWRELEKAAVRAGGGVNHRVGLWDMVLIKENHIAGAGGVEAALSAVAARNSEGLPVEIEVRNAVELDEALRGGPNRIMLDNMSNEEMQAAVRRVAGLGPGRPELEASGNVDLERIRAIAETGVDFISVGALTHSAAVGDLSLRVL